ncbi:MAG: 8-oxo-dGTP diphosphatase [Clostridia bacterium]|nr:8-oxo-dGTP diphosphatase [Clostridia bacterium]
MRATTLCYIERDGQYLMLHRVKKKNDANQDKWIGIGGGIEPGETPEQCLLREVKEETGLTLTEYRYRAVIDFVSDKWEDEVMHLFTATGFTGELIECDEGNLEWIGIDSLLSLPQWEGDRIFLNLLKQDAPFFRLRLEYKGESLARAVLNGKEIDR